MNSTKFYSLIAWSCLFLGIWTTTLINGQYETLNNLCGGYFRYIRGSIEFKFNSTSSNSTDLEKLCVWTVSPTKEYSVFRITQLEWPTHLTCDDYAVTINGFAERDKDVSISQRYCGTNVPTFPLDLTSTVLIITLKVRSVEHALLNQGDGFKIVWKERDWDDALNATRLIETYYSWGRPSIDPLPYYAAGFISNGMKTFVWPKANYSDGSNYEFHLSFDNVEFGYRDNCTDGSYDFLLFCYFDSEGRLKKHELFENVNVTDTQTYISNYGFFIIYWGGECRIGGGGRMQLYYEHVRIS